MIAQGIQIEGPKDFLQVGPGLRAISSWDYVHYVHTYTYGHPSISDAATKGWNKH